MTDEIPPFETDEEQIRRLTKEVQQFEKRCSSSEASLREAADLALGHLYADRPHLALRVLSAAHSLDRTEGELKTASSPIAET